MEIVKQRSRLPTIKISLSFDGGPDLYWPAVNFEVGVGSQVLQKFTVDPSALGVPRGLDPGAYRYEEPSFWLGPEAESQLVGPARYALGGRSVLWLQLASPVGFLGALPWERMLEPAFGKTPILRIPDFTLSPERGDGPVNIVLCVSEPDFKPQFNVVSLLDRFVGPGLLTTSNEATVHVFADLPTFGLLMDGWNRPPHVVLHDPRATAELVSGGKLRTSARAAPSHHLIRGWRGSRMK